jgi:hypothetical protein
MKHLSQSYFYKLLWLLLSLCLAFVSAAQTAPPHDVCAGAYLAPVRPLVQFDSLLANANYLAITNNVNQGTVSMDSIFDPDTTSGFSGKYKLDTWFTFTPTTKNVAYLGYSNRIGTIITFYSGTCGNLTPIKYYITLGFSSTMTEYAGDMHTFAVILENLVPGQQYFARVGIPTVSASTGFSTRAAIRPLPDVPRRLITTAQGGNFLSPSTWVGGAIPTEYDTLQVADGATLQLNANVAIGHFIVGAGGPAPARVQIDRYTISYFLDDVHILSGDTMRTHATGGLSLYFLKNLRLDGGFRNTANLNGNQIYLYFVGLAPQRVYGNGRFTGKGIPFTFINNRKGMKWEIDGVFWAPIHMVNGFFDHSSANVQTVCYNDNSNFNYISADYHFFEGSTHASIPALPTTNDPKIVQDRTLHFRDYFTLNNKNVDSIMPFYRQQKVRGIRINKWHGRSVNSDHNIILADDIFSSSSFRPGSVILVNGILKGKATDTIYYLQTAAGGTYIHPSPTPRYIDYGTYISGTPMVQSSLLHFLTGRNGRMRYFTILNAAIPPVNTLQRYIFHLHDEAPSGTMLSPLTMFAGSQIIEFKTTQPLADTIEFRVCVHPHDNIIGPKENLRLIQAPTKNGPWKVISGSPVFVSSAQVPYHYLQVKKPDLSQGNFFSIGSISNLVDARIVSVHPRGAFRFGCPGNATVGIPVRVQNIGLNALSTVVVGALINGQVYSNLYSLSTPLGANQIDSFRVEIPQNLVGAMQAKFFTALPGDGNTLNDTLSAFLPYNVEPMPYRENFDTVTVLSNYPHAYSMIRGYENKPGFPPTSGALHRGFSVGGQTNKVLFVSGNQQQEPWIVTMRIGPLGSSSWFSYLLSGRTSTENNPPTGLGINDTLVVEATDDCGATFKRLRAFHRNNLPLVATNSIIPIHRHLDSLPFPVGSYVSLRFRTINFSVFGNASIINIDDFNVIDTLITGNKELTSSQTTTVYAYPNPVIGTVQFKGMSSNGKLIISTIEGKVLLERCIKPNEDVDIRSLAPGIYLWRIEGTAVPYTGKIIKE